MIGFVYDDGGRVAAGYVGGDGRAEDCVVRAIAIAGQLPYRDAYDSVAALQALMGGRRTARGGIPKKVTRRWFKEQGWTWTPTMQVGQGCTVHLRAAELPAGRLVAAVSKHLVAVIDGVVHDTDDPSRDGTRCVYGYWTPPEWAS